MPNLAWTYATLTQALQDWEVHSSIKFLSNISNIVGLGERRLWGDLNIEDYDKTLNDGSIKTTAGNRIVAKPADVIQVRTFALIVGGKFVYLELRSQEYCQIFSPDPTVQVRPTVNQTFFFEDTFSQVQVVPTPDAQYNAYFRYLGALPESLSASSPNTTTWLSRAGSDVLLYACLASAEHFIKGDDRYDDMMKTYNNELLPRLRAELRRSIRSGDASPMKAAPTLAQ